MWSQTQFAYKSFVCLATVRELWSSVATIAAIVGYNRVVKSSPTTDSVWNKQIVSQWKTRGLSSGVEHNGIGEKCWLENLLISVQWVLNIESELLKKFSYDSMRSSNECRNSIARQELRSTDRLNTRFWVRIAWEGNACVDTYRHRMLANRIHSFPMTNN